MVQEDSGNEAGCVRRLGLNCPKTISEHRRFKCDLRHGIAVRNSALRESRMVGSEFGAVEELCRV